MGRKVVLAIDLGTSGSRVMAFTHDGHVAARVYSEFPQHFPQPGWVEHDPDDYLRTSFKALRQVLARVGPDNVVSVGITNQRETTLVWDAHTGRPVYPAIVWQDRRTDALCDHFRPHGKTIRARTGLILDPYFSATKIRWILDHRPSLRRRARNGGLCFGTPDVWLLWHLTGRKVFATEPSNAARTLLFNLDRMAIDPALCRLFGVPQAMLPVIYPSDAQFGMTDPRVTQKSIPIVGVLGDQQAALFAQAGEDRTVIKNTYGTGIFALAATGSRPRRAPKLLSTVAWRRGKVTTYALEGSVFMAGAALQWLRDNLGILKSFAEAERVASSAPGNEDVYFVPAFQGLGAPYWQPQARAIITGMSRKAGRATLVRAALEALAYQSRDVIDEMQRVLEKRFRRLRVDGGGSQNDFLMQFQADVLGAAVERPPVIDTTAFGVALLSGLSTGFWNEREAAALRSPIARRFTPSRKTPQRQAAYRHWQEAVRKCF